MRSVDASFTCLYKSEKSNYVLNISKIAGLQSDLRHEHVQHRPVLHFKRIVFHDFSVSKSLVIYSGSGNKAVFAVGRWETGFKQSPFRLQMLV